MKKIFTPQDKARTALKALTKSDTLSSLASSVGTHPIQVGIWKKKATQDLHMLFENSYNESEKIKALEKQVDELHRILGKRDEELSWLQKKLPSNRKHLIDTDSDISISRQAKLLGISRSSVYQVPTPPSLKRISYINAIDEIYTAHPFYGQRRIRVILERDYNIHLGREAIRTAMHTLGITTIYPGPNTSIAHPNHSVYPYLLRGISINSPNHIWSTDITYIRLENGFCYLVALLDWYSRKVLSWRLSNSMETTFCIEALSEALEYAQPFIHNSDQGSQFTSNDYLNILRTHENINISMDGRGRCFDNIFIERLWRIVKYEDIYLKGYSTMREVYDGLTRYFRFYNEERPHQSLGYKTPDEVYYQS